MIVETLKVMILNNINRLNFVFVSADSAVIREQGSGVIGLIR